MGPVTVSAPQGWAGGSAAHPALRTPNFQATLHWRDQLKGQAGLSTSYAPHDFWFKAGRRESLELSVLTEMS